MLAPPPHAERARGAGRHRDALPRHHPGAVGSHHRAKDGYRLRDEDGRHHRAADERRRHDVGERHHRAEGGYHRRDEGAHRHHDAGERRPPVEVAHHHHVERRRRRSGARVTRLRDGRDRQCFAAGVGRRRDSGGRASLTWFSSRCTKSALTRNGHPSLGGHFTKKSGGVLLSHEVPLAVPSAQKVLASGFGM